MGHPAVYHLYDPARGLNAAPIGMLRHFDGAPAPYWDAYLGVNLASRRFLGAFPDSLCGESGRKMAIDAIIRSL